MIERMGKRRRRRYGGPNQGARLTALIAVAVVGVLVVVLAAMALNRETDVPTAAGYTPKPQPTPVDRSWPTAVFIGDSYTVGAGGAKGGFVKTVARSQKWAAVNLGRGGTGYTDNPTQTQENAKNACGRDYCESFREIIPLALKESPDIVVVSGGRVNSKTTPATVDSAVQDVFASIREALPNARIIAISPLWDSREPPEGLQAVARSVKEHVEAVGGEYLDVGQPLGGHPEMVAADLVHPNDDGYSAIASAVVAALGGRGLSRQHRPGRLHGGDMRRPLALGEHLWPDVDLRDVGRSGLGAARSDL
ncbi:SGNH/GDSL hydrolase family protein [Microbacterium dauci]|uniref:SGNH/GDSL hydrolase family protein n=1 Tax=Microbacterium dauci TaxID=3048008 RepID=A0ABT6ZAS7_9MICO|nr:SGNH/GDSL hydrolase family protein [Microbacterium sp. LX3-4]MDJ1113255.1 SGNH/GDSL hydrolase family protein [Microbacterium sp. LX3-4]